MSQTPTYLPTYLPSLLKNDAQSSAKVVDLGFETPGAEFSTNLKFECIDGIIGRIMPFNSLYILDFVWPDGKRVERAHDFAVWALTYPPVRIQPAGSILQEGYGVQVYYITSSMTYEIRRLDGRVIKTISFSRVIRICSEDYADEETILASSEETEEAASKGGCQSIPYDNTVGLESMRTLRAALMPFSVDT